MTPGTAWELVLDAPRGDPRRKVGGLSLALRLALDAASAGASAIVVDERDTATRSALDEPRLRLPVITRKLEATSREGATDAHDEPTGALALRLPATFLVHRRLLRAAAEDALARGKRERDLALEPLPLAIPYGFEPVDVTDDASARRAERLLFRSLRKPEDGWTSRWLNRSLSLGLSRWLVKTPLRPNQLTLGILGIGLVGAWFASLGTWGAQALGALLYQAQSVLDGCDGEVSRVTHRGSKLGEWLDTVGDDITNYSFFAAAAWGLATTRAEPLFLWVGWGGVLAGLVASGLEYRYLIRIGSGDLLKYPLSQGKGTSGALAALQPLFKRDTFVFLTLVAALIGRLDVMVIAFSLGAVGVLATVVRTEVGLARERHG